MPPILRSGLWLSTTQYTSTITCQIAKLGWRLLIFILRLSGQHTSIMICKCGAVLSSYSTRRCKTARSSRDGKLAHAAPSSSDCRRNMRRPPHLFSTLPHCLSALSFIVCLIAGFLPSSPIQKSFLISTIQFGIASSARATFNISAMTICRRTSGTIGEWWKPLTLAPQRCAAPRTQSILSFRSGQPLRLALHLDGVKKILLL